MDPVTAQLITQLVQVVVPLLFGAGRREDAEALQRLHTEAKKNWGDVEQWANTPTRPPSGG
jgi:hypothetical protein